MPVVEQIANRLSGSEKRVVFPEADDPRIAQAMARLKRENLCIPVSLAPSSPAQEEALVSGRGVKPALAKRMLRKDLIRGAAMVAAGEADAMVAGISAPTRKVIEAAGLAVGLGEGVLQPSSFFLMSFPDGRLMVWADCAVQVSPTAEEVADIARVTQHSAHSLLGEATPALLSYSTGSSGVGQSVDLVRKAAERAGIPGPVQADAALNPDIATAKGLTGGDANVLIFPNLDAGNIAYKLAQELAGAQAIGPILQGFAKPICDLSRGATAEDIYAATIVTLALAWHKTALSKTPTN